MSKINSLKVDKLADLVERIFKQNGGNIDEASILDEYISMVNISRNIPLAGTLPTDVAKRTMTMSHSNSNINLNSNWKNGDNFKRLSLSKLATMNTMLNVPDSRQLQTRYASISKSQTRSTRDHNGSDDYSYQLLDEQQ